MEESRNKIFSFCCYIPIKTKSTCFINLIKQNECNRTNFCQFSIMNVRVDARAKIIINNLDRIRKNQYERNLLLLDL